MAKRPILNKAHDAATNKGAAITIKRVSISDNPFEIFQLNTLSIIIQRLKFSILELNFCSPRNKFSDLKFYF